MTLKTIRLGFARTREWPQGNRNCGYEFKAPLTADGHIDVEVWRRHKRESTVRRFWRGEADERGHLIHTRHRTWAFSYAAGKEDDTPFFRFESHAFVAGEYVTIAERDGTSYTFKVVSVT